MKPIHFYLELKYFRKYSELFWKKILNFEISIMGTYFSRNPLARQRFRGNFQSCFLDFLMVTVWVFCAQERQNRLVIFEVVLTIIPIGSSGLGVSSNM